jgi:hypothetical protein
MEYGEHGGVVAKETQWVGRGEIRELADLVFVVVYSRLVGRAKGAVGGTMIEIQA